jgi:hypothetical protein
MATTPQQPPEKQWTPKSIRVAVRELCNRIDELELFDPRKFSSLSVVRFATLREHLDSLERAIERTLRQVFEADNMVRRYRISLNPIGSVPLDGIIDGVERHKKKQLELLRIAIQFLEGMQDYFPREPLDQMALSASTMGASSGGAGLNGVEARGQAGKLTVFIQNDVPTSSVIVADSPGTAVTEAAFELLRARVALLEAAISAPKPVVESPVGIGHNGGPDLALIPSSTRAKFKISLHY